MLATGDTAGRNAADASPGHVSRQDEQGPQKKKKGEDSHGLAPSWASAPRQALDDEHVRRRRGAARRRWGALFFSNFVMENSERPEVGGTTQYNLTSPSSRFRNSSWSSWFGCIFHPLSPQCYFERNFGHPSHV